MRLPVIIFIRFNFKVILMNFWRMSPSVSIFDLQRQGPGFVTLTVLNCDWRVLDFKYEL